MGWDGVPHVVFRGSSAQALFCVCACLYVPGVLNSLSALLEPVYFVLPFFRADEECVKFWWLVSSSHATAHVLYNIIPSTVCTALLYCTTVLYPPSRPPPASGGHCALFITTFTLDSNIILMLIIPSSSFHCASPAPIARSHHSPSSCCFTTPYTPRRVPVSPEPVQQGVHEELVHPAVRPDAHLPDPGPVRTGVRQRAPFRPR